MTFRISSANRLRRATNESFDPRLIEEARALEVDVSRACERELIEQIGEARAARWLAENREAITAANAYADQQALQLSSLRLF